MEENKQLLSLFPIPVYISEIAVLEDTKQQVRNLEFADISARNGKMTVTKKLLELPQFEELATVIDAEVQSYASNIFQHRDTIEFVRTTSWSMLHHKGDWSNSHAHANAIISGILYLDVDDNSGDLVFNKTLNNLQDDMIDITATGYNPFNSRTFSIRPKSNYLVIFPSNLSHKVTPCQSDNPRYCIAFNYFVKGTFGKDEGELVIS